MTRYRSDELINEFLRMRCAGDVLDASSNVALEDIERAMLFKKSVGGILRKPDVEKALFFEWDSRIRKHFGKSDSDFAIELMCHLYAYRGLEVCIGDIASDDIGLEYTDSDGCISGVKYVTNMISGKYEHSFIVQFCKTVKDFEHAIDITTGNNIDKIFVVCDFITLGNWAYDTYGNGGNALTTLKAHTNRVVSHNDTGSCFCIELRPKYV